MCVALAISLAINNPGIPIIVPYIIEDIIDLIGFPVDWKYNIPLIVNENTNSCPIITLNNTNASL